MKTLLVLAQHPDFAEAIRGALNSEQYRVIHRIDLEDAQPLLSTALVDICLVDVELSQVQGLWLIEKLRRRMPNCPVLVFIGSDGWEWEEEAYLQGVSHVLTKPVRPRLLNNILERITKSGSRVASKPSGPVRRPPAQPVAEPKAHDGDRGPVRALEVMRDFSAILTHSLCAEAMLKQFLMLLREIIGVNRAAIFLRQPFTGFGPADGLPEIRRFRSTCAIGLSHGLLEHFELSFEAGIGGYLYRQGRILRQSSDDVLDDVEIQKEFELLGAEVAIPILDRETLVGVATFDGRITGEALSNGELELIFHLLEELGLAVKNIWLHDQLAGNHEMMADILRQLSSACVVVSRDMALLHVNKTAQRYFSKPGRRSSDLEFSDLPAALGSKVYQVLKTGTGIAPFKYHPPHSPETVYQVSILPFQRQDAALPSSALLVVEDQTQSEQLQRLEIEATRLRLVRTMADRMAHEIGNAIVPLSTYEQLIAENYQDAEFRASLQGTLSGAVKRISRLTNQMRFLAQSDSGSKDAFPLAPLIEEAFQEAQKHLPATIVKLDYDRGSSPVIVTGDRGALKHALTELLLNALQANPSNPKVTVRCQTSHGGLANGNGIVHGQNVLHLEIQDNGQGFTPDLVKRVEEPFFTTRNVGLGLGMTVSRKIVENHHGKLNIASNSAGQAGVVRISLPLETGASAGLDSSRREMFAEVN
jgi:signal transduction histidine kinase/DNA-binding NarL/FixJ family response regulator